MKDDEFAIEDELGFEPAVPASAARESRKRTPGKRPLARKLGSAAVLLGTLSATAGAYAVFATTSGAVDAGATSSDITAGKQIFETSCITCHGANLQGVKGRGPSLIAVGGAAAYFQVSTGRMPAVGQGANNLRKEAKFTDVQTRQLAAYVESIGGGPDIPSGNLRLGATDTATIADGGELFRLNCASCHGTTFKGAPLSAGKIAPALNESTDLQMYTAMLSGPESMPIFSDNQLTPEEKRAIIAYVQTIKASKDPGGSGIDRIGPVSEAIVLWVGGIGALMIAILWIGAKTE